MKTKKQNSILLLTVLSGLLGGAIPALAHAEVAGFTLDPMVVTATRQSRQLSEVPASVTVIQAEDLERMHVKTVNEALVKVPGIYANRLKGIAQNSPTVLTRGFSSQTQVLVLVDDQPLNDANAGTVNWSDIPMEDVQRIEVVKGSASNLYGSQAMGGVINIITKKPVQSGARVSVGYGSEGTWIKRVSLSEKLTDKLGIKVHYEGRNTHGYVNKFVNAAPTTKKPSGTLANEADIKGLMQTTTNLGATTYRVGSVGKNRFEEKNFGAKLNYQFSENKDLTLSFLRHVDTYGYDYKPENNGLRLGDTVYTGGIALANGQYLNVGASSFFNSGGGNEQNIYNVTYDDKDNSFKVSVGLLDTRSSWSGTLNPVTNSGSKSDSPNKRYSFNMQKELVLADNNKLLVGAQYMRDWIHKRDRNIVNGELNKQSEGSTNYYALYLQDEYQANDRLMLMGGLRYDYWKVNDSWMQLDKTTASILNYDARSNNKLSPKLAAKYKLDDSSNVFVSWGRAFTAPSLQKMFSGAASSSSYTEANPELKPMTVDTVELGYKKKIGDKATLGVTYFRNSVDDLLYTRKNGLGTITYTVNGKTYTNNIQKTENAGSATINGIEVEYNHKLSEQWQLFGNYVYQNSKMDKCSTNPAAEGKQLTYVPKQVLNFGVDYTSGKLRGELIGSYRNKMYGQDDNSDTAKGVYTAYDGFFIMGANVSYAFDKNKSLTLSVNNIFDREYYSYNLCEGRNFMLTFDMKF